MSIAPSMSSGRMLDTVENVAAYYGPAVFVFFAACFGRPRATAACSGSPATVAPLSLSRAPLSSGPAAPDDRAKDGPHSFAMLAMRPELVHGCTVATVLAGFDIPPWSDRFSVPEAKAVPAPRHAGRLRAAATSSPENLCTAR